MLAPCKGCEERKPRCHGQCEKYRQFREAIDRRNEAMKLDNEVHYYELGKMTRYSVRRHTGKGRRTR